MHASSVIIDANIFVKLLHPEPDSNEAKVFFKTCAMTRTQLTAPELFRYEIAEVTRHYQGELRQTLNLLDAHQKSNLQLISPTHQTWLLAERIAKDGHPKSGFPTMYDSIYHALAIESGGVFLTADQRHYRKTKHYGQIKLLSEWETIFY